MDVVANHARFVVLVTWDHWIEYLSAYTIQYMPIYYSLHICDKYQLLYFDDDFNNMFYNVWRKIPGVHQVYISQSVGSSHLHCHQTSSHSLTFPFPFPFQTCILMTCWPVPKFSLCPERAVASQYACLSIEWPCCMICIPCSIQNIGGLTPTASISLSNQRVSYCAAISLTCPLWKKEALQDGTLEGYSKWICPLILRNGQCEWCSGIVKYIIATTLEHSLCLLKKSLISSTLDPVLSLSIHVISGDELSIIVVMNMLAMVMNRPACDMSFFECSFYNMFVSLVARILILVSYSRFMDRKTWGSMLMKTRKMTIVRAWRELKTRSFMILIHLYVSMQRYFLPSLVFFENEGFRRDYSWRRVSL